MILYHGTRVDGSKIKKEGLEKPDFNKLIDKILGSFGYSREEVSPTVWKPELDYRLTQYQYGNAISALHFTLNYDQAKGYAMEGGEFEYLMVYRLFLWKQGQDKDTTVAMKKANEYIDKKIPKVVTVDVPNELIDRETHHTIEKIQSWGEDPYKGFSWDIKMFQDIPPEWIVKIEKVKHTRQTEHLT